MGSKASVRVTSDSSAFQQEMKKAVQSMKELSSETSLATTQAKLFGSAQDALKAKVSGLQVQISQQADIVKLNKDRQQELVEQLDKWKSKQSELQSRIQDTKAAIEQSTAATGENSNETKTLKEELAQLTKEEKDAAAQVNKTEERLSKQTVATNKSEQALVELQGELQKTNTELKDAAWDEWTKKADKATEAMDNVGQKLTVVTGAVVAMGTAAIKTTADFDVGMSNVQAVSGATGEELDALREKALEMGAKTAFSASEAAAAMEYMAQAGWTTEDMLAGIEGVMNAAAASGEDLATTSSILTEGLTSFGMAADESARFADVLVAAGNASNTSVADMGETFKYAGAVCGTLGITIEDAAVATGLMANAGIKASNAGTALRSGLSNLVKPTKAMSKAMKQYGISVQTTSDGSVDFMATMQNVRSALGGLDATAQAAALSTIFGKEAMSGWAAIVTASDEDFQNLTDTINDCTGAAEEASAVRMDNLTGQIEAVKGAVETIAIQIGDILMPTIRNVVAKIQEWADAFVAADEGTKKAIVTIAGVVAAIGPMLLTISKVIKTAQSMGETFRNLKDNMNALKIALNGPTLAMVGIIAAIAALVAAFKHLWDTNESFRTTITAIWNEIKTTVGGFIEGLKERLNSMGITFESVSAAVKTVWNALCDFLAPVFIGAFQLVSDFLTAATNTILDIIDFFVAVFQGDWEEAWEEVQSIFGTVWQYIVDMFKNATNTLKDVADVILGWFGTDWNTVWTEMRDFFVDLWNDTSKFFTNTWNNIKTMISTVWNNIKSTVKTATNTVKTTISGAWNSAKTASTTAWNSIKTTISTAWNSIKSTVTTATNTVKTTTSGAWNSVKTTNTTTWNAIQSAIGTAWNSIKSTVTTATNTVKTTTSGAWNSVKTASTTTWNSIQSVIGTAWNGIKSTATNTTNTVKTTVSGAWNSVKVASTTTWNAIQSAIATPITNAKNTVSAMIEAIKSAISGAWNAIKSASTTTWNAIQSAIATPITNAKNTVSDMIEAIKDKFDFSWSLPTLKLPHLSVSGSFSISPPSVPEFSIKWYKTGAIMDGDTIFGMNGNTLLGGGEAGKEAILPLEPFYVRLGYMLDEKLARVGEQVQNIAVYVTNMLDGDEIASRQIVKVEKYMVGTSRAIRRATT